MQTTPGLRHPCRTFKLRRLYSTPSQPAIINLPKANIHRFGDSNKARPVFRDLKWTVKEDEAWAIVGSGSGEKGMLFQFLLGHLRAIPPPPPPGGLYPFLSAHGTTYDPFTSISFVSFSHSALRSTSGEFYDYTARYGAVREEDKITLRQSMFPETIPPEKFEVEIAALEDSQPTIQRTEEEIRMFEELIDQLELRRLLDLPLIALSNGQARRARIIKAILKKPQLLLLDEPLTGLDTHTRPILLSTLQAIHASRKPRVMMGLRSQDTIPNWITHLAWVKGGEVFTGPKSEILERTSTSSSSSASTHHNHHPVIPSESPGHKEPAAEPKEAVVQLSEITIKYGDRTVLDNLSWTVRRGERWHLQGSNGSGKTTLLSLITGDHPQSYTQPPSSLLLHHPTQGPTPRRKIPTPIIQSVTGVLSPELFDAFPRRANMKVWEAVGTGFDGGFVPRGKEGVGIGVNGVLGEKEVGWRVKRCWDVIEHLGPAAWDSEGAAAGSSAVHSQVTKEFAQKKFVDLSIGEQRMVLLMRALVGRAPLILLDEVWSGMDEKMIEAARAYLRSEQGVGEDQAVVVITHWEEEVPWGVEEGLKRIKLEKGRGVIC